MRIFDGKTYRDMTSDEIANMRSHTNLAAVANRNRPVTEAEMSRMLITQQINALTVDDNMALRMVEFYPAWENGADYAVDFKVRCGGKLWRCLQAHTAQAGWEPENAAALWEQVCFHYAGTADDPIPYEGNMALERGKHYFQDSVIYLCIRDTESPVYHALADLVGQYVEAV